VTQVAELLGCSPAHVYELCERGDLPHLRDSSNSLWFQSGLLNKQVGSELGISEVTVKTDRGRVMRKMKAPSLADLVITAARLHVIQRPRP
jgi:hypothetical protein